MRQITIPLDDESVARLRELARQRGGTMTQIGPAQLLATLLIVPLRPSSVATGLPWVIQAFPG